MGRHHLEKGYAMGFCDYDSKTFDSDCQEDKYMNAFNMLLLLLYKQQKREQTQGNGKKLKSFASCRILIKLSLWIFYLYFIEASIGNLKLPLKSK